MGIENIDILKPDSPATQVRERRRVSQHIVEQDEKKYVFGWDQALMSFFLQVHDLTKDEDDEDRIPVWLGATKDTQMYEVEDLARAAARYGLNIHYSMRVTLYGEKDDGV